MHNRFDWKEMIYLQLILLRSWKMQYQGKIGLQSKDQGRQMKGENEIANKEEDEDFVHSFGSQKKTRMEESQLY